MRSLFYTGIIGLILFEIANVYFIMPMPGSQRMHSIDLAYFLYSWRWFFRVIFAVMILAGIVKAWKGSWWLSILSLLVTGAVVYLFNFVMAAEKMFYQPHTLLMKDAKANTIGDEKLVIGVVVNDEAKAYPIQLIAYHHQVMDSIGGNPAMITYCSVCRTGRVYRPVVKGKPDSFRLVGMDHFDAIFEDAATKSWWRQATGKAIAGSLKGESLPVIFSQQSTLKEWLRLYPNSLIMQPDTAFNKEYKELERYDSGKGKSNLTKTDTGSWKDKSWVVGIQVDMQAKAFDWNRLVKERIINNKVGEKPVVLVLAADNKSFFAFERPSAAIVFTIKEDILVANNKRQYNFKGEPLTSTTTEEPLKKLKAYQEFWHSWRSFHPGTEKY